MPADKGSGHIKRNRPPRVQISYEDPYDAEAMVELPFVMGVLSDLSGNNPGVEKEAIEDRSFTDVTKDTLDGFMASVKPGATFMTDNKLEPDSGDKVGVALEFSSMDDFEPAKIAAQVPALRKLLEARQQLANLQKYMSAKPKAQEHIKKLLNDPDLLAAMAERIKEEEANDDDA